MLTQEILRIEHRRAHGALEGANAEGRGGRQRGWCLKTGRLSMHPEGCGWQHRLSSKRFGKARAARHTLCTALGGRSRFTSHGNEGRRRPLIRKTLPIWFQSRLEAPYISKQWLDERVGLEL